MKKGFNMIELVFVIVILGILASIAVPRLITNRDDAEIVKAKTVISSVRSYIQTEKNNNLLAGTAGCPKLETNNNNNAFSAALSTPPKEWEKSGNQYTVKISGKETTFTYDNNTANGCTFQCKASDDLCGKLEN